MKNKRIQDALNGDYNSALTQLRAKEKEIKEKYVKISANISFIKNIDRQEKEFESKVKPGLMDIVDASIHSAQNSVALAIRKKTGTDIEMLRKTIEIHKNGRSNVATTIKSPNNNQTPNIRRVSSNKVQ